MYMTKYCPEVVKIITENIAKGDFRKDACAKANISVDTFCTWMKEKPEFSDAVKRAEFSGNEVLEAECLAKIKADKSWQSSAWLLERRIGNIYRPKHEVKNEVKVVNHKELLDQLDND